MQDQKDNMAIFYSFLGHKQPFIEYICSEQALFAYLKSPECIFIAQEVLAHYPQKNIINAAVIYNIADEYLNDFSFWEKHPESLTIARSLKTFCFGKQNLSIQQKIKLYSLLKPYMDVHRGQEVHAKLSVTYYLLQENVKDLLDLSLSLESTLKDICTLK